MRLGLALTIFGGFLALASVAYLGWALFLIGGLIGGRGFIGETGRTVGDWYFIGQVALHGLVLLIPSVVTLFFGIKRLRSIRLNGKEEG